MEEEEDTLGISFEIENMEMKNRLNYDEINSNRINNVEMHIRKRSLASR